MRIWRDLFIIWITKKYLIFSGEAREATKLSLRKEILAWLEGNREWDTQIFLNYVQLPQVQDGLDQYVQSLRAKASKWKRG